MIYRTSIYKVGSFFSVTVFLYLCDTYDKETKPLPVAKHEIHGVKLYLDILHISSPY